MPKLMKFNFWNKAGGVFRDLLKIKFNYEMRWKAKKKKQKKKYLFFSKIFFSKKIEYKNICIILPHYLP